MEFDMILVQKTMDNLKKRQFRPFFVQTKEAEAMGDSFLCLYCLDDKFNKY